MRERIVRFVLGMAMLSACGPSRLSPQDACETLIESSVRCGTYRVGTFGGTSVEDDIARCASGVALLNETCQQTLSDAAMCSTGACEDLTSCQPLADRFARECR